MPYTTRVNTVYGEGLIAQTYDATGSARAAKTLILAHLVSDIYPDSGIQAVLESYLDDWIDLGTDVTSIDGGSIGNISGVTMNIGAEREEIRRQTLVLVPFWRAHDEIQRSRGGSVSLIR